MPDQHSRLRKEACIALVGLIKDEVLRQTDVEVQKRKTELRKSSPMSRDKLEVEIPTVMKVHVPQWLYAASANVESLPDPTVLGVRLVPWEHEEIEAVFWNITMTPVTLGMYVEENTVVPSCRAEEISDIYREAWSGTAEAMYNAYGASVNWKAVSGHPMPAWGALPLRISGAWCIAAEAALDHNGVGKSP